MKEQLKETKNNIAKIDVFEKEIHFKMDEFLRKNQDIDPIQALIYISFRMTLLASMIKEITSEKQDLCFKEFTKYLNKVKEILK